jgi:AraC-like DNA-binding protein
MGMDEHGCAQWTWANARTAIREQIISMLQEGYKQKEIATACGCDPGYVSRIKKEVMRSF